MKAIAFSNNDIAVIAWTLGGKLNGCLGFAISRIDVQAGTETPLPAMATFKGQAADAGRTTFVDPIQKFFWKDVSAIRGRTYRYRIVPMGGTPGNLKPLPYGPLMQNQIQLTPDYGALAVYFNRGILATQATANVLGATPKSDALPAPHADGSTRRRPALQSQTAGLSPALGPHAAKPAVRRKAKR